MRFPVLAWRMALRACYATSGTAMAQGATCVLCTGMSYMLRACYAMPDTGIAYVATRMLRYAW
eukprot:3929948-Rhodomonas_salina.3